MDSEKRQSPRRVRREHKDKCYYETETIQAYRACINASEENTTVKSKKKSSMSTVVS